MKIISQAPDLNAVVCIQPLFYYLLCDRQVEKILPGLFRQEDALLIIQLKYTI